VPHDERDGSLSDWLGRFGISWPGPRDPLWSRKEAHRLPGRRTTRALRRFVETLRPLENPAILDLGPACGPTVSFLGHELGCRLVVADLYAEFDAATGQGADAAVRKGLAEDLRQAAGSADGVLCWDLFDYLSRGESQLLGASVARVLRPGGVALALFSSVAYAAPELTRYAIDDIDHLTYRPVPSAMTQGQVWSGRDIARIFSGLRVDETYLLAHGLREVVLRKLRSPQQE
jgi:hypothetical protein